jgi:YlmC/YmxH family sporulation protein
MIKISDLRTRDVINVVDGKKLGSIIDIDLDLENGRVLGLVMPGHSRGFHIFSRREEVTVPWHKIVRIGRDVILVEVPVANEIDGYHRDYRIDDDRY